MGSKTQAPEATTPVDGLSEESVRRIALALAIVNGHPEPEVWAAQVAEAFSATVPAEG